MLSLAVTVLCASATLLLACFGIHRIYFLYRFLAFCHPPPQPPALFEYLPRVTVQLPIFNELHVVERLIRCVAKLDYPRELLEIQVLDDSTDETQEVTGRAVKSLRRRGLDISHIHRPNRDGFKAGAMAEGLRRAKGEFVAIFDADFLPPRDFLKKTIHHFTWPDVGMVQARWGHLNAGYSFLTRVQSMLLDGHFAIEHTVRQSMGRFFNFNGTAGVWRRRCIEDAGGWQHDTLTEDLDLSYRAQMAGWRFVYLPDVVAPAELPVEMNAYKTQQRRWARGSVQTALKLLPTIWRSPLPWRVKVEATFHLTGHFSYLLMSVPSFLVLPAAGLRAHTTLYSTFPFYGTLFVATTFSVVLFILCAQRSLYGADWRRRLVYIPWLIAIGVGLSLNNAKAVVQGIARRESVFERTPKYAIGSAGVLMRGKRYSGARSLGTVAEFSISAYFAAALVVAADAGLYHLVPVLLLFLVGYSTVAIMSVRRPRHVASHSVGTRGGLPGSRDCATRGCAGALPRGEFVCSGLGKSLPRLILAVFLLAGSPVTLHGLSATAQPQDDGNRTEWGSANSPASRTDGQSGATVSAQPPDNRDQAEQESAGYPGSSFGSASKVTVLPTDTVTATAGATVAAPVRIYIGDGWHINSNVPNSDYLIKTEMTFSPSDRLRVVEIRYPRSVRTRLSFAEDSLDVYHGSITVFAVVLVREDAPRGMYPLKGKLQVQACNDRVCLSPSDIGIETIVRVVAPGAASAMPAAGVTSTVDDHPRPRETSTAAGAPERESSSEVSTGASHLPPRETLETSAPGERAVQDAEPPAGERDTGTTQVRPEHSSTVFVLLGFFAAGLALNLTPCVYPMITVTVSLFGSRSATSAVRALPGACTYVLGMATTYSLLGVSAALTGGLFGHWLQSSWSLAGIALLLFLFSLGMFGLYEIRLPYRLTRPLGSMKLGGPAGTYLSGLVVGVFAAPCTGPAILALLTLVASRGDPVFGFWAFFILSLGLGLPYLILGTFSGLLGRLPKSGYWMVWIKRVFGIALLGVALFYAMLAVSPRHAPYVLPVSLIVAGSFLGGGAWLSRQNRALCAVLSSLGATALIAGVFASISLGKPTTQWEDYTVEAQARAQSLGKMTVLDFYADWCIPCIELDRLTFTDPRVILALDGMSRFKVNLTHFDSRESAAVQKRFGVRGVPTVVFLRPDGTEVLQLRIVGYVPANHFLERLQALRE